MCECFACMCTKCLPGAHEGQKKRSDPLESQLRIDVSSHVGPKNQTQVL